MRYIVIGDIHGDYNALQEALSKAKFNPDQDCFIGLGDYFDRGAGNIQVFDFLCSLPHKHLILGNHDVYLYDIIHKNRDIGTYDFSNGTLKTICDFANLPKDAQLDLLYGSIEDKNKILDRVPAKLSDFIKNETTWFYETPHYIFTHGFIPLTPSGKIPKNLSNLSYKRWYNAAQGRSIDQIKVYRENYPQGSDKTIVVGHWANDLFRADLDGIESFQYHDNWTGEKWVDPVHKIIGLDSTTVLTHCCDYVIIEEEDI